jgi:carbonic anhydrase
MKTLPELFEKNKNWANRMVSQDPKFFERLSQQQSPKFLWIGCSDSRVPANQITGLEPGEMFVHRNVANQVYLADFNALSVIQYAVDHLKVEHIIICGHENCGGVKASMQDEPHGMVDNWIRPIREIFLKHKPELMALGEEARLQRLCELNVRQQVLNLCATTVVQDVWKRGQYLSVHGWFYALSDGLLRDTGLCVQTREEADQLGR